MTTNQATLFCMTAHCPETISLVEETFTLFPYCIYCDLPNVGDDSSLTYPGDFERSAAVDVLASLEPQAPRGVQAVAVQLHAQHVPIPESAIHLVVCPAIRIFGCSYRMVGWTDIGYPIQR